MVAPLIIIIISLALGSGLLLFTPVGGVVINAITDDSTQEITQTEPTETTQTEPTETTDNSPTGMISEIFEYLRNFFQNWVKEGDIEKYPNPLKTTNEELEALTDTSVSAGERGADFFFAMEAVIVALIMALSPIELAVSIVAIIAFIVTLLVILKFFHGMARHMLIVFLVIGIIVILFMTFNLDISI